MFNTFGYRYKMAQYDTTKLDDQEYKFGTQLTKDDP